VTVQSEHRIDVGDGALIVLEAGSGPPLVLLHGWPLDHRMFGPQIEALSGEFRCIALDRRGFGRSAAPADMRREPDDIDRVFDELALESAHLLGVSQGGRIALRYAATRPERLRSLLLQGAVVDGLDIDESDAERVPVADFAALAADGRLDEVKSRWLAHPLMQLPAGHAEEEALLRQIVTDYGGSDLLSFERSHYAFDADILGALADSNLPVLLLTGAAETDARKAHAEAIRQAVRNCREIFFEKSGHLPNLTEAGAVNACIREFLLAVDDVTCATDP
jgi:pimeloyl-ACP methyl ester carboxylesterase